MIPSLKAKLLDPETSLPRKYRVLFALKNLQDSPEAHDALLAGLGDRSTLFRHEVAYCLGTTAANVATIQWLLLGQTQNPAGVEALTKILADRAEHPMVRHEAGEALGAIGTPDCVVPLRSHITDAAQEVSETCRLALQRIGHSIEAGPPTASSAAYSSVDPAPAEAERLPVEELRRRLVDEEGEMFERYKALFALRNAGGSAAVRAIADVFACSSALLKHEAAFVLGQMQDNEAVERLKSVLEDAAENPMVRHEAAEALGSIAEESCVELLKRYVHDPEPIVAESCLVAVDMLEHEQSGAFEYVDTGTE